MSVVEDFLASPTLEKLSSLVYKRQWKALAEHYGLSAPNSLRLNEMRELVLTHLSEDGVVEGCEQLLETTVSPPNDRQLVDLEIVRTQLEVEKSKERTSIRNLEISSSFCYKTAITLLPQFREAEPDEFFFLFEKLAQLHSWPTAQWSLLLAKALTGRAQDVYTTLSLDQARNYQEVKAAVLDAYRQVPEAYRVQFRNCRKADTQTYVEHAQRKSRLLARWLRSLQVGEDFQKFFDLVVYEEVRQAMPYQLRVHIDQLRIQSLTEAISAADTYVSSQQAHPPPRNNPPRSPPSSFPPHRSANPQVFSAGSTQSPRTPAPSASRPGNTHFTGERANSSPVSPTRFCRYCKSNTHLISECPELARKNRARTQFNSPRPVSFVCRPSYRVNSPSPVANVLDSVHPNLKPFVSHGTVCIESSDKPPQEIAILRDTGASLSLIRKKHVPQYEQALTGESVLIRGIMGDGLIPLIRLSLQSGLVSGDVTVGVVDELPVPAIALLLGNDLAGGITIPAPIMTAQPLPSNNTSELEKEIPALFPACAVTRSMTTAAEPPSLGPPEPFDPIPDNVQIRHLFSPTPTSADGVTPPESCPDIISPPSVDLTDVINRPKLLLEQHNDPEVKKLATEAISKAESKNLTHAFYLESGILMRKFSPKDATVDQEWRSSHQVVVPSPLRQTILQFAHEGMGGHLGIRKTRDRILDHFWWPKLQHDVSTFCNSCSACQLSGKSNLVVPPAPLQPIPVVNEPFSKLVIDIVGPLPKTKQGNQYLLTVVDVATRYPEAFPLRKMNAKSLLKPLTSLFTRVGLPTHIHSDQGTNFTGTLLRSVLDSLGVTQIFGTAYHPQSQGLVERFHRTFKDLLTAWCLQHGTEWDEAVDILLFAIRDAPSESLGYSPFQLIFGHKPRGPLRALKECMLTSLPEDNLSPSLHVSKLQSRLKQALSHAHKNLKVSQEKMKTQYDSKRKAKVREFKVGESVLLLLPTYHFPFEARLCGPYTILEQDGPVNYVVSTPDRRKSKQKVHVNLMRKYSPRSVNPITAVCDGVIHPSEDPEVPLDYFHGNEGSLTNSEVLSNPLLATSHLTSPQQEDLALLLQEYSSLFGDTPSQCPLLCHDVNVKDASPVRQPPYRLNQEKRDFLQQEIQRLRDQGLIEPSLSPWASPVVMVPKPDGTLRLCIDYRRVNAVTEPDCHPLPRIDDIIDEVGRAAFVSTLDLTQGYYQVPLSERARPISAFITPDGLWQWRVMPFGLRNAPATFQRLMAHLIRDLNGVRCYLDDIVVFSDSWEQHLERLKSLFSTLAAANLTVNLKKSTFGSSSVTFLGHQVGHGKVAPRDAKVTAIRDFPVPQDKKGVMRYLGLCGYYRRFCRNFSTLAEPLTNLLKARSEFVWSEECQNAFVALKRILVSQPVLHAPNLEKPFTLQVDASDVAAGAVLLQKGEDDSTLFPVGYFSVKFKSYQKNYSVIEKETLALVLALEHFKVYVQSSQIVDVHTDHNPLTFLAKLKNKNQRLLRWSLILQQYNLQVSHIKGSQNIIADALSRP